MQCRGTVLPLFVAPCQKKTNPYNNLFTINTIQKNVHLSAVRIYFGRTCVGRKTFPIGREPPSSMCFASWFPPCRWDVFLIRKKYFSHRQGGNRKQGSNTHCGRQLPVYGGNLSASSKQGASKQPANKQQQAASQQAASQQAASQQAASQQAASQQPASKQKTSSK